MVSHNFSSQEFITLTDLCMLNHPYVSGINPTWWMMNDLFSVFWIWCASILLRIFAPIIIRDTGLVMSLSGFGIMITWSQRISWELFLPLLFSIRVWKVLVWILETLGRINQWSHVGQDFSLWAVFHYLFNLLVTVLSGFLFLPELAAVVCVF